MPLREGAGDRSANRGKVTSNSNGGSASKNNSGTWSRGMTAKRLEERVGRDQLSGRYHKHPRNIASDYAVTRESLGTGLNGDVMLASSKAYPSHKFAVKSFDFEGLPLTKRDQFESEVEVFLSMDHPHIARLMDVYEYEQHISLVMEHMSGGELFDRLHKLKRFSERDASSAAYQMLLALNYLHCHGIIHGDVKLENFMYDTQDGDHLKLIDFGFSRHIQATQRRHIQGTVAYMAPEALEHCFTSQCDQWSLGVVMFTLLSGYMPFGGPQEEQMRKIAKGQFVLREERWSTVSEDATEFVMALLRISPKERLTAQQALEQPFIKKGRVLQDKADIGISIVQALRHFGHEPGFRRCCLSMIAWSLSNAECTKAEEYFEQIDEKHQGTITFDELKKIMVDKYNLSCAEVRKAFQALDTHHDDEIHYSDFLAAMVSHNEIAISDEHMYEVFRRFDTHDTGFITADDLREVLGDRVEGKSVESFLRDADTLNQGYITYHEFVAYVLARPLHLHGDEIVSIADIHVQPQRKKSGCCLGSAFPDAWRFCGSGKADAVPRY